jgi:crossover junction endodeoxyribonuclease RuvC
VVLGMDLSLAGTGLATATRTWSRPTKGREGAGYPDRLERIRLVRLWVFGEVRTVGPELVVLEGPAPNATQRLSSWDRAKLWWDVVEFLDEDRVPVAFVPPNTAKKYGTGDGHCKKTAMIGAAYKRLPLEPENDNEADAAWLMAMGRDWLGDPLAAVPQVQRRAIDGAVWPVREGRLAA